MKTNTILTCALLALTTISCNDLDVDIKSQYTEYPVDSDIALEARISNAYYAFRAPLNRRYDELLSLSSDEYSAVCFNGGWLDGRQYSNCSTHSWEASANNNQLNVYSDILAGITNCNQLLQDLGDTNPEVSNPVRAARAFYTFLLMDNFGDTPIVDYKLTQGSKTINRSPRADAARWIESELLDVRDKCPSEVNEATYGTPTCWMVDALLAKLYINWNVYTQDVTSASWNPNASNEKLDDCIAACDRIINSGLFNLNDDYKEKFMYNNGPQIKDFIYAVPYEATLNQGMCYARYRTWRYGGANGFYTTVLTPSCGGNFAMNPEFADLFCLPGDRRNDVVVGDPSQETTPVYEYDPVTGEVTTTPHMYEGKQVVFTKHITLIREDGDLDVGADGTQQGYRSIKFYPDPNDYNVYERNQDNDIPIFRYADILLTKCEAITRGGTATLGDTPKSLFNQIRTYVSPNRDGSLNIDHNPSLQEILDERGREFLDEHWRRNDLIRFGDYERAWGFKYINPDNAQLTRRIFPLSQDVLNSNTNWQQNEGY